MKAVPSSPAVIAMVAWPLLACWPGLPYASTSTTCRCTGSSRLQRAKVCRWRAPRQANGSNALDDGPSMVVFDNQTSRAGAHARDFLKNSRGHLTVDDYSG